jgi:hypothetical protein
MAHMWFGDLVTMKWFDDLWLNESFATYMGSLASAEATRFKDAWTFFAADTKVEARIQDEMPTTHPIVADISDVDSVHLNFDKITYNKGGAVLKQLAAWLGEDTFFDGVHLYLERHSYANATLADFLAALEEASGRDLKQWAHVWLEEAGLNKLAAELEIVDGKIKSAAVLQTAPESHPILRPHHLRIGLFDMVPSPQGEGVPPARHGRARRRRSAHAGASTGRRDRKRFRARQRRRPGLRTGRARYPFARRASERQIAARRRPGPRRRVGQPLGHGSQCRAAPHRLRRHLAPVHRHRDRPGCVPVVDIQNVRCV